MKSDPIKIKHFVLFCHVLSHIKDQLTSWRCFFLTGGWRSLSHTYWVRTTVKTDFLCSSRRSTRKQQRQRILPPVTGGAASRLRRRDGCVWGTSHEYRMAPKHPPRTTSPKLPPPKLFFLLFVLAWQGKTDNYRNSTERVWLHFSKPSKHLMKPPPPSPKSPHRKPLQRCSCPNFLSSETTKPVTLFFQQSLTV